MSKPLPIRFYQQDTIQVAQDLLGCEVWVQRNGRIRRGRIVEAEAYRGFEDRGCLGWRGETPRLRSLFGPPGRAFIYVTYGVYHMLNAVTERPGFPAGVLIRALEPVRGIRADSRGPGLLTRALGIDRRQDGGHLVSGAVRLLEGGPLRDEAVAVSTWVGVEYAGPASAALPWRFFLAGNPYVSRGRPTDPARAARLVAERARRRRYSGGAPMR